MSKYKNVIYIIFTLQQLRLSLIIMKILNHLLHTDSFYTIMGNHNHLEEWIKYVIIKLSIFNNFFLQIDELTLLDYSDFRNKPTFQTFCF